jgi:hypothetical protein
MAEGVFPVKPGDRATVLNTNRQAKMAESAHAHVRGNTLHFYEWLNKHLSATIMNCVEECSCSIRKECSFNAMRTAQ